MKKSLLTAIVLTSISFPFESSGKENTIDAGPSKERIEQKENPIYPIISMAGSLILASGALYYSLREQRKKL